MPILRPISCLAPAFLTSFALRHILLLMREGLGRDAVPEFEAVGALSLHARRFLRQAGFTELFNGGPWQRVR